MMFAFLHRWPRTGMWVALALWLVGLAVLALVGLAHHLYFVTLPLRAIRKCERADPERLRRIMERVVATPSLLGRAQKLVAQGALLNVHLAAGRHAEAVAHARAQLAILAGARARHARLDFPALEADVRRRLADCLDGLGRAEEAEQERRRAEACVKRAPDDTLRHITRGTLLERRNRHAEAREAFEQALAVTPETNRAVRIECLIHLVLACFNDARPDECLARAEEAIALGAEGKHLRVAHRMAGVVCGSLGRLDEAEEHERAAYAVAEAEGDTGEMAQILGGLSLVQFKRGRLAEANEACIRAAALDPKGVRMASAVQSYVFWEWGRYDDALGLLGRYDRAPGLSIPYFERRTLAVSALDRSRMEAECGRADDAWAHIQEARAVLRDDAKLGLICEGGAGVGSCSPGARRRIAGGRRPRRGRARRVRPRPQDVPQRPVRPRHGGLGTIRSRRGDRPLDPLPGHGPGPGPSADRPVRPRRMPPRPGRPAGGDRRLPRGGRRGTRHPLLPPGPPPARRSAARVRPSSPTLSGCSRH